jgi:chemotaxis protein methyltransferase CheR
VSALSADVHVLSGAAGLELDSYRPAHVAERVRRALKRERLAGQDELVGLFQRDDDARTRFRRSVAVSVSGLFRDPAQFELLERELLPPLVREGRDVSVWSAGCADGSELYSTAIVLERLGALDGAFLLGSDVLEHNLAAARRGVYGDVQMGPTLRERTRWELRDLIRNGAPAGKWRLILCRNVAIYLTPAAKRRLYEMVSGALAADGVLVIGRSERLTRPGELGLEPAGPNAYRRIA